MKILEPQLIVDLKLYPTETGGRQGSMIGDWPTCVCMQQLDLRSDNWDCRILLSGNALAPGESRRVGMVFLSGERAANALRNAGRSYLWEWRVIGEAVIVG